MNKLDQFTIESLDEIINGDISSAITADDIKLLAKFALEAKLYGWVTNDSKEVIKFWNGTLNK